MSKPQSDFTTPEQSKRLLELGVPADSANCFYDHYKKLEIRTYGQLDSGFFETYSKFILCWSVGQLIEIYDTCLPDNDDWPNYFKYGNLLEYVIDCIDVAIEKELIDFSKLEE